MASDVTSKDFVFSFNKNGELEFVGDFEGLYQSVEDPWGQSAKGDYLDQLYKQSRQTLKNTISEFKGAISGCEIGCGLGHVTNDLNCYFKDISWDGIDISNTAVKKAQKLFPSIDFIQGDIASSNFSWNKSYDVVILNQILWYLLEGLDKVFFNLEKMLKQDGHLIISTFFLKDQKYGTDIIGSFDDLIFYILSNHRQRYKIILADIKYGDEEAKYRDSILVLKKL
ncbi:class I SAM-dependent methyltransferase [Psychrobium sp. MM17-31]|uniref:class I SAM-dependent methyltransferase n=1 Tax=Psychrobium sp. MM17-31 TaxID=2917758 RepID=UPI001EF74173|nr:class I SAM-dependent methyltransferase [Psychrobium sp. MM17-31]MCG7533156.1 class I SAM-dependent methyltransferase [Psychrobium sp. MM17-31]